MMQSYNTILKKNARYLIGVLCIYTLFSYVIYQAIPHEQAYLEVDSVLYDRIARNFAQYNQLKDPHHPKSVPLQPVGYPFFMGLIYKVWGYSYNAIIIIQLVAAWCCALLTFLIAYHLFDVYVARIALLFFAFHIGFLTYPFFILAEIVTVFFVLLFWWLFLLRRYAFAGLSAGLSVVIKSVILLYIPISALAIICIARKRPISTLLLFIGTTSIPIIGYMTYNYCVWGYWQIAPLTSLNIYQVFFSKILASLWGDTPEKHIKTVLQFKGEHYFDESGWRDARALFWTYFKQEPVVYVYVWMQNVSKSMCGLFSTQLKVLLDPMLKGGSCSFFATNGTFLDRIGAYLWQGAHSWTMRVVVVYEALWSVMRIGGFMIGLFMLMNKKYYVMTFLIISFIMQCVLITGFDGCARYRLICEPLILVVVAAGTWGCIRWLSNKKSVPTI